MLRPRVATLLAVLALGLLGGLTTGCSASPEPAEHTLHMAAMDSLPLEVRQAPATVREAYQFAAANKDVLEHLPCYCGCGDIGHTSNYACYVAGAEADGALRFDGHALGCSICVDITQDAMRLLRQGQNVEQIREYVDSTYAKYGPSNIP